MTCESVILAAGLGTRMKSDLPKVLHHLGGRPLVAWVLDTCRATVGREPYMVVGPDSEAVRDEVGEGVAFVEQTDRLGTGHALLQAAEAMRDKSDLVLVVSADMPLLTKETLGRLVETQGAHDGPLTLLTAVSSISRGFGRLLRDPRGMIVEIVEEAQLTHEHQDLQELNVGAYCFRSDWLWDNLARLELSPKGEYYLTDLVSMAVTQGLQVAEVRTDDEDEIIGINTREHLAEAETILRRRINRRWMLDGVSLVDPATIYIGPEVVIGGDTVILPNTHLEGRTVVGKGCRLGPNTIVRDSTLGEGCKAEASVIEHAVMEEDVEIGPFTHLRKGAYLCRGVRVGNFGEVKSSRLGPGVKMGHFSYIGDASIEAGVNIGAGTITCNYDGESKHPTEIGEGAFIGSDTMLVAPVRVGRGARTGAGSVVTHDVPDHTVAVGVPARVIRKLKALDE